MRALTLVAAALLAAGCATPRYLAKVNGQDVTPADLKAEFEARHAGHKRFLAGEPDIKKFVNIVVDKTLLVQEGNQIGLAERADVVGLADEYSLKLQLKKLQTVEVDDKAKPTEEEIKAIWETQTETMVETLQIVVDTEAEARAIRAELEAGGDFDAIARARSIAPSAKYGGRLAKMGWGAMDPEWEAVIAAVPAGQVSPVFRSKDGWEVVQVFSRRIVVKPEYASARKRIEGILMSRKRKAAERSFHEAMWTKYGVHVKEFDGSIPGMRKVLEEKPDAFAVTWNGGGLKLLDFADALDLERLRQLPPTQYQEKLQEILNYLVDQKILPLEAAARQYGKLPDIAEKTRRFQDNIVEEMLLAEYVLPDVKVTDADVEAYYEAHKSELLTPERRRVSHIVLESAPRADEVAKKVAEGVPFPELVQEYSTDATTRKNAGSLGEITKGKVNREFDPVFALQVGETTAPIQTQFGWHIFKVTGILPPRPKAFDEAKEEIRARMLQERRLAKRNDWVAKLRAAATIEVSDVAIHQFAEEQNAELARAAGTAAPSHMGGPGGQ